MSKEKEIEQNNNMDNEVSSSIFRKALNRRTLLSGILSMGLLSQVNSCSANVPLKSDAKDPANYSDLLVNCPFYDVRAFGAKGDGVTNDTLAIQAAIEYAHSKGGGTVYLPAGTYIANITIAYDSISLVGSGMHSTIIKPIAGIGILIKPTNHILQWFVVANLMIDGGDCGLKIGSYNPYNRITKGFVYNVHCFRASECGVFLDNLIECTFVNVQSYFSGKYGLYTHASSIVTLCTFITCVFNQSGIHGVYLRSGKNNSFIACSIEANWSTGLLISGNAGVSGAQNIKFDTCWFEDNALKTSFLNTAHVIFDGVAGTEGTKNILLDNCIFSNKQPILTNVYSNRSKDCKIINADFYGKKIEDAVRWNEQNHMTYNFLIKDYKNPNASDIYSIQTFDQDGAGITLEYQIGRVQYSNLRKAWCGGKKSDRPKFPQLYESYFDSTLGKPIWWNGSNWVDFTGTGI